LKKSIRRVTTASAIAAAALTVVGAGAASAAARPASAGLAHATSEVVTKGGVQPAVFPDPGSKLINGFGSNTVQDVYGAFTQGFTYNGSTYKPDAFGATVGSWTATNPSTNALDDNVTPVAGGDTFQRPDGSGDGRNALSAAWSTTNNSWTSSDSGDTNTLSAPAAVRHEEISFSRSSSLPSQSLWTNNGEANQLTFIPQATDAVGVAEQANGSDTTIGNLATGTLTALYGDKTYTQSASGPTAGDVIAADSGTNTNSFPEVVTGVTRAGVPTYEQVVPIVPQASSGTRSFFLSAIGDSTFASIVANETGSAAEEEENDASADLSVADVNKGLSGLTVPANSVEVVPFSGAALIEQRHGLIASTLVTSGSTATFFPTVNGDSLTNGETGANAAVGSLQSAATPETTYGASVVGDFDRYVWAVLPSSVVTSGDPSGEAALQKWLDQTVPGISSVWEAYGFKPVSASGVSDNPSDWVTTEFTN
jgi:hypothetical protein